MRAELYTAEFVKLVRSGQTRNLSKAGDALKKRVKEVVSVSGRTVTYTVSKSGKVRKHLGALGGVPSKPGEPPHKQTGRLYRSITKKIINHGKAVRVGGNGVAEEYGTRRMKPRPFLRSTLAKMKGELGDIMTKTIG